ncbi:MAG: MotA/TolQ/ExbB proton channel family protein, partial [Candidatus Tectomicrobia bacterium]|nr:MotA/TolQ/ExbB proton channel family protein [Candidatus Tectomicrobia bacterium]
AVYFRRNRLSLELLGDGVTDPLRKGNYGEARAVARMIGGFGGRVVAAGLEDPPSSPEIAQDRFQGAFLQERIRMEKGLSILGTLGNNAPFIGLFGTVLGIIRAFYDLSFNTGGGPSVVMRGISEALVATAAGLFVAIPAVIAYNYFQRRVKEVSSQTESVYLRILSLLRRNLEQNPWPETSTPPMKRG